MSEFQEAPTPVEEIDKRENLSKIIARVFGIASLVLSITATSLIATASTTSSFDDLYNYSASDDTSYYDDSWVPAGFEIWADDSNIAWKWSSQADYECDPYRCIEAQFISRDGCPTNFYAAVNWLDAGVNEDGAVIGYDNSSLPSLYPMQVAKVKFDDPSDLGLSAQISEIDCR
jgi:hypothetical protein